jgi:signal transduction histidine kinase
MRRRLREVRMLVPAALFGAVVLSILVATLLLRVGLLGPQAAILLCALLSFGTGLIALWWIDRRWTRSVLKLSRSLDQAADGEFTLDAGQSDGNEVILLSRRIHGILAGVRQAREQSLDLARKQAGIEKFAALGRLSAGVAHEINNPVGGILTCLETMKEMEPGSERYQDYLALVRSGLERIGKIVGQLLRFSRHPTAERREVDLNETLREAVVLSGFDDRKKNVEVLREFGPIPKVLGDPDLLHQMFLNLVLNAFQAIPEGGRVTLRTYYIHGRVGASVSDTGAGLPEEHLDRIFEPFFTTKDVGVGTGLGLSVALGIAESHGGTIEAENLTGAGARFTVWLPPAETPQ